MNEYYPYDMSDIDPDDLDEDDEEADDPHMIDLGPCCICEGTENVRNILQLDKKSPTPGKGWGCFVCDMPMDGAIAVICDDCLIDYQAVNGPPLKYACTGYPAEDGRTPIDQLTGSHEHDRRVHEIDEQLMEGMDL